MIQKVMLMILDGWGFAPNPEVSAVDLAQTPNIDALFKKEAGDSSEWDALVTSRTNTKNKYPKS